MNNVEDFMAMLAAQQAPMSRGSQRSNEKKVEKIALNFHGNFGRYQIMPVDSVVSDMPFVTLFNTYEICVPRTYKNNESGTEEVRPTWVKILPKDGFKMKDQTGRIVSSLTNEEETLLYQVRTVFDELYKELDAKNNIDICKDLLRRRNYTIFNGYCINKWSERPNDNGLGRQPDKVNFSGLFISTAKGFTGEVQKNLENKRFEMGEDMSWVKTIYNRLPEGRGGCIMMTIGKAKVGVGFDVNVNHLVGANTVKDAVIPAEDLELMTDPVAEFLGWQAKFDEENTAPEYRRLFNSSLMKEVLEFMSGKLAAIRTAKSAGNGLDLKDIIANAINVTNAAVASQPQPQTNDPMLQQAPMPNMNNIQANNTTPFQNPPVYHNDPATGAPVNVAGAGQPQVQQAAPFNAPSFANFGGQPQGAPQAMNNNDSLPF